MARTPSDAEFSELVEAVWPGLYRTAYLILGEHQLAEDLVQTALAKTYASWHRVRDVEAGPGYAKVVLANTAASWFRRRSWRNERPTAELPDERAARRRRPTGPRCVCAAHAAAPACARWSCSATSTTSTSARWPTPSGSAKARSRARRPHALERLRVQLGDDVDPPQRRSPR